MTDPLIPVASVASENSSITFIYSEQHAAQGITRAWVEVFNVGPYRYTNLADALAQARRDGDGS